MSFISESVLYLLPVFVILFFLAKIVRTDVKNLKIRNSDVFLLFLMGLGYAAFAPPGAGVVEAQLPGSAGLKKHLIGFVAVLLFGFFLFASKLWGAGDAKLLASLAIWEPYHTLPRLIVYIALFGGAVVLVRMIVKGNTKIVLRNIQSILMFRLAGLSSTNSFQTADRMPFSVAIAGGWFALVVIKFFGI
jgi:Flp pilus assembly protein protease CpaA